MHMKLITLLLSTLNLLIMPSTHICPQSNQTHAKLERAIHIETKLRPVECTPVAHDRRTIWNHKCTFRPVWIKQQRARWCHWKVRKSLSRGHWYVCVHRYRRWASVPNWHSNRCYKVWAWWQFIQTHFDPADVLLWNLQSVPSNRHGIGFVYLRRGINPFLRLSSRWHSIRFDKSSGVILYLNSMYCFLGYLARDSGIELMNFYGRTFHICTQAYAMAWWHVKESLLLVYMLTICNHTAMRTITLCHWGPNWRDFGICANNWSPNGRICHLL